jgi:hypothetical protein
MDRLKRIVEDILYHLDTLDEQGFSNSETKAKIKELVDKIMEVLYG